jgi:hypothetical protein
MDLVIAVLLGNLMQYGTILINNVFGIAEAFFKRLSNYLWHPAINTNTIAFGSGVFFPRKTWRCRTSFSLWYGPNSQDIVKD